jgi:cell division protein FtsX
MITDPSGTLTFPNFTGADDSYTLDDAYYEARNALWTTLFGALISWALFGCLCIQLCACDHFVCQ